MAIDIADSCGISAALDPRSYDVTIGVPKPLFAAVDTPAGYGGEIWTNGRFKWNYYDIGGCDYPDARTDPPLYVCGEGAVSATDSGYAGEIVGYASVGALSPGGVAACGSNARHKVTLIRQSQ